mmetsp:Transcript_7298/g.13167  ORF Transcript_7298/g.13167 Transcript_7298/m.13167 type:complete len:311 (-) Transcript_7298:594-1526(-)
MGKNSAMMGGASGGGYLNVMVVEARNMPDKDVFGKQDPYCVLRISHGTEVKRTRTMKNAGKHARWMQNLAFTVTAVSVQDLKLYVEVYDEDPGKDDLVGRCEVSLAHLANAGAQAQERSYSLQSNSGRYAGDIVLDITFQPAAKAPKVGAYPGQPGYGQPAYGQPASAYGAPPAYGAPAYGAPNPNYPPGMQQPPAYGAPPYGAPSYPPGMPQQGYPNHAQPFPPAQSYPPPGAPYAAPYGQPPSYQPPHSQQPQYYPPQPPPPSQYQQQPPPSQYQQYPPPPSQYQQYPPPPSQYQQQPPPPGYPGPPH